MVAIASAKEASIRMEFWVMGILATKPEMDGDGHKYILCHFGNVSIYYTVCMYNKSVLILTCGVTANVK